MSAGPRAPGATMQAAVLHGRRDLRIERVPVPRPGPGEVLIEVTSVGVCGTDAAEWGNGPKLMPVEARHPVTGHHGPLIMGHEFAGRVVGIGAGVGEHWQGALVASCGAAPCGECAECTAGRSNVCRRYWAVGLHRDGALADYVTAPAASCVEVESLGIGEHEAALVQPMSIAVHAARRSGASAGDRVVVQGVGGVGAFLIHVLVALGAEVIAVDLDRARLDVAQQLGASRTIVGGSDTTAAELEQAWGDVIPVFFEVSGTARGLSLAVDVVPMGTTVVVVGIAKEPYPVDMARITVRELSLIGTNAMVRETDLTDAARLVAERAGRWDLVAPLPVPFSAVVRDALAVIADGRPPAIKTLVLPPSAV
ncbi:alcohol dehydrogenase catalytic domain-containing protein [Planococcus sp. APC 4015]|nr:alcohol dehydrogenase catalytic domain-containing protein [Planococcus sp. APC 4015]